MGRDSSVDIATCYGLYGPGIESRWGRHFQHSSRPALGPTQPPIQWVPGLSWGVKRPGRGVDHPPPSSGEVEGRVELYMYSPSGPSWRVLGRPLPLSLPYDIRLKRNPREKEGHTHNFDLNFKESYTQPQVLWPTFRPRIEPETTRLLNSSSSHSTTTQSSYSLVSEHSTLKNTAAAT